MPDSPVQWKAEAPTWRGWGWCRTRDGKEHLIEICEEHDASGVFLTCVSPGHPLFIRNALKVGYEFGPPIPSVQECAALDSARAEEKQSNG